MNNRLLLTGMLAVSLLMPVSEAKAQGYPTFDIAKLASLITNLMGRFQPVPQVLSRVNQVKTTMSQIQAVAQSVVSGDLKSIGKSAMASLQSGAFTGGKKTFVSQAAEGANGAKNASKAIEGKMFHSQDATSSEILEADKAKTEYVKSISDEAASTALYLAMNSSRQSEERFKKADEAMKKAETVHDNLNANTMMIMNGNYERLNQITLKIVDLKLQTAGLLKSLPAEGYIKPKASKNVKFQYGESYSVQEKDEIDVKF